MAKVYFRYGAMNAGKSTALMQVAYNYEEQGMKVVLLKPALDTKGDSKLISRIGLEREIDLLVSKDDNIKELVKPHYENLACVLVDEVQFFTPEQIDQLRLIAVEDGIPIIAYGIRTDFQMKGFPGSSRILQIAHDIEEIKTICACGRKAICNMRKINGKPVFSGEQVAIDGVEATYESVCGSCFQKFKKENT